MDDFDLTYSDIDTDMYSSDSDNILEKKINFVFIRHGQSCHNLIAKKIHRDDPRFSTLLHQLDDPTLTEKGVSDSIEAGKKLQEILQYGEYKHDFRKYKYEIPIKLKIKDFDFIGCSPMIRAIETCYYMSLPWKPEEIHVMPFLRETHGKKSDTVESTDRSYPMQSIDEQKKYFKDQNINNINFKFVENNPDRLEPGNIAKFIEWFGTYTTIEDGDEVNILIVIHANIMSALAGNGPHNNAGFILSTTFNDGIISYTKDNLMGVWSDIKSDDICTSERCPGVC